MHNFMNIPLKYTSYDYYYLFDLTHESILYNKNCLYQLQPCQAVAKYNISTRWRPLLLIGGGGAGGGGAALDVFEVAGVTEKVAVQRIAAVTLLIVQLYLAFLSTQQKRQCQKMDRAFNLLSIHSGT